MIQRTKDVTASALAAYDDIIDVRSPAEFAEDHVPGAINLPVLTNEQRAEIGTIYKQDSRFRAKKLGASYVAASIAKHLEGPLADREGRWHPLVYCWRGGMRSGAMATVLSQVGWRVSLIEGGYRTWRRRVVAELYDSKPTLKAILLLGHTGTGKTDILKAAAAQGAQTLDLEGLAGHRGSLLGGFAGADQPSQKLFETRAMAVIDRLDRARPVLIEAESSKIGRVTLPPALWQAMEAAPAIRITATLEARADYLVRAYADIISDTAVLKERLAKLKGPCSKTQVEAWSAMADAGDAKALAASLMENHYDAAYDRWSSGRTWNVLGQVEAGALDHAAIEAAAERVIALKSDVDT